MVVDEYTGVTFAWAFNEPVIKLPGLNVVLTIGRCMVLIILGFVAGFVALAVDLISPAAAATTASPPFVIGLGGKLLLSHTVLFCATFGLLRALVVPRSKQPEASLMVESMMAAVELHSAAETHAAEWAAAVHAGDAVDAGIDDEEEEARRRSHGAAVAAEAEAHTAAGAGAEAAEEAASTLPTQVDDGSDGDEGVVGAVSLDGGPIFSEERETSGDTIRNLHKQQPQQQQQQQQQRW